MVPKTRACGRESEPSTPPLVQARLWLHANFLTEGGVVCEFCVPSKSRRQIRVRQKLASECDQVRSASLEPSPSGVLIEATGFNESPTIALRN